MRLYVIDAVDQGLSPSFTSAGSSPEESRVCEFKNKIFFRAGGGRAEDTLQPKGGVPKILFCPYKVEDTARWARVRWCLASISSPRPSAWSRFGPLALRRGSFQGEATQWYSRTDAVRELRAPAGHARQVSFADVEPRAAFSELIGSRASLVRSANCTCSRAHRHCRQYPRPLHAREGHMLEGSRPALPPRQRQREARVAAPCTCSSISAPISKPFCAAGSRAYAAKRV